MTRPARIQLSRRAGFDLQATSIALNGLPAIVVARPMRHGNPYRVVRSNDIPRLYAIRDSCNEDMRVRFASKRSAAEAAVAYYRDLLAVDGVRRKAARELRGKNVACWCGLDMPCHGDVLLEVANG